MTVLEEQIQSTIENFKREVQKNGATEAADKMWQHALSLRELRNRQGKQV